MRERESSHLCLHMNFVCWNVKFALKVASEINDLKDILIHFFDWSTVFFSFLFSFQSFPELHSKAERLQQAVHSRQAMQECETDGVLFALENKNETLNSSSTEPTVLQDDESTEKLKMVDFLWWGGERRRSRPPVRFDASQNTYGL